MNEETFLYYIIGFDYEGEYAEAGLFLTEEKAQAYIDEKGYGDNAYVSTVKVNL